MICTRPDFSAIRITPSQNAIIPINENDIFTAVLQALNIEFVTSPIVPFSMPIIIESIIKPKNI